MKLKTMKYFIKNFGEIQLTQQNFVASGGEGKIYKKGKIAYKIYDDPSKMIPIAKIQELSVLTNQNIIRPEQIVLDMKNNTPIGYTMKMVEGSVLCQIFTKAFKLRNNIDNHQVLKLIKKLYQLVSDVHKTNILIVDLNELNFLFNNSFDEIYAIDVNSYQTPSFPATVIMESVRDRHCNNKFNQNTDWFSWGIVAFQMLIGIHPYKGNHPKYENLPLSERMNARMKDNVSVFDSDVKVPKVCEPLDSIPSGLRQWFRAVFEDGKRLLPPSDFDGAIYITPIVQQIVGSKLFDITEIASFNDEIISYFAFGGNEAVTTKNSFVIGRKNYAIPNKDGLITFTSKMSQPMFVYIEKNQLKVFDVFNQSHLTFTANADAVMRCGDRIYYKNVNAVLELFFETVNGKIQCLSKVVGNVLDLPSSTKVFDGGIIQNLLGRYYVSIFPTSGYCYQIPISELDDYQIIDAKYENKILMIVAAKNGKYDRMIFKLNDQFESYSFSKKEDVTYSGLNFTVTEAGVAVLINENENVEIFSNKKDNNTYKEIDDTSVDGNMKLCHNGASVQFYKGKSLFKFSMVQKQ